MINRSDKAYDIASDTAKIYIPACAALYFGLADVWNFPFSTEVVATCALLATFLGVVLKLNNSDFKKTHTVVPDNHIAILEHSPPGVTLEEIQKGDIPGYFDEPRG